MFGLGITEIVIILAVAAVIFFFYWRSRKNKAGMVDDVNKVNINKKV